MLLDQQVLRLAYESQLENIREAKRGQWNVTSLAGALLFALGGAFHAFTTGLQSRPDKVYLAWAFTIVGGFASVAAAIMVQRRAQSLREHRRAILRLARLLDPREGSELCDLLTVPPDYGERPDVECWLLVTVIIVGAGILGWLLLGGPAVAICMTLYWGLLAAPI